HGLLLLLGNNVRRSCLFVTYATWIATQWEDKSLTNSMTAVTELAAAMDKKVSASLDSAEPPPAKSERALIAMKGILC
ncbi:hypothetical protein VIGAN_02099600, partial [Vigna angularis var. angularis]